MGPETMPRQVGSASGSPLRATLSSQGWVPLRESLESATTEDACLECCSEFKDLLAQCSSPLKRVHTEPSLHDRAMLAASAMDDAEAAGVVRALVAALRSAPSSKARVALAGPALAMLEGQHHRRADLASQAGLFDVLSIALREDASPDVRRTLLAVARSMLEAGGDRESRVARAAQEGVLRSTVEALRGQADEGACESAGGVLAALLASGGGPREAAVACGAAEVLAAALRDARGDTPLRTLAIAAGWLVHGDDAGAGRRRDAALAAGWADAIAGALRAAGTSDHTRARLGFAALHMLQGGGDEERRRQGAEATALPLALIEARRACNDPACKATLAAAAAELKRARVGRESLRGSERADVVLPAPLQQAAEGRDPHGACWACGSAGGDVELVPCGRCERVSYCSVRCRQKDWKTHKPDCL
ncbi:unnamed protein product [Pedinophyceae sp. YPF-701]|nr:unnamed protein product [Pedinophyceae sp. YPF-701]